MTQWNIAPVKNETYKNNTVLCAYTERDGVRTGWLFVEDKLCFNPDWVVGETYESFDGGSYKLLGRSLSKNDDGTYKMSNFIFRNTETDEIHVMGAGLFVLV